MVSRVPRLVALFTLLALVGFATAPSSRAHAQDALETDWVAAQANKARARLSAGSQGGQDYALLEVELEPGWKTYWRNPGDAGLPPELNWDGSENIAKSELLFPAPHRFVDKAGETIGYNDRVVFPVRLTRSDAGKPATLVATFQYGVCKDICIPAEAQLSLALPAGKLPEFSGDVLAEIPRDQGALKPQDPVIVRADAVLSGASPRIEIEAKVQPGSGGVEGFLAAEGGVYVPSPVPQKDLGDGRSVFIADLGGGFDVSSLKDRVIAVTVTSSNGASTAIVKKIP